MPNEKEVIFSSGSKVFRDLTILAVIEAVWFLNILEGEVQRNEKLFPILAWSALSW